MIFILIPILIFFSFLFSSLEAAIFSLNPYRYLYFESIGNRLVRIVFSSKNRILTTILISNTFVNVLFAQLIERSFHQNLPTILITLITTLSLLIFGEYTPKIFGIKRKNFLLKYFLPIFSVIYFIEYPIHLIFSIIIPLKESRRMLKGKKFFEDLFFVGEKEGALQEIESKLSSSIITISKMKAKEIMIPKDKYYFINENSKIEDIITFIPENIKRFPVYRRDPENVVGIIDLKDILCEKGDLKKYIKSAVFVSENTSVSELLKYLKRTREKMILIVGENNILKGVVDIEHIEIELIKKLK
uniref:DUF21 domain-containing protein n=1 Tax=candidate division WOR-3 bacterium TaxID=2052148 RepID=A0A7C4YFM0_UNCW3